EYIIYTCFHTIYAKLKTMFHLHKKSVYPWFITLALVSFGVFAAWNIFNVPKVSATPTSENAIKNATFEFIDRANIEATIGGQKYTFHDQDIGDGTYHYK